MNSQRVAELLRQLADAIAEGETVEKTPPAPAPPASPKRRRRPVAPLVVAPIAPPDDLTRARARDNLQRIGFRRP